MSTCNEGPHWYVVKTNPHQERLAKLSLRGEGIDTYLPMAAKTNHKREIYGAPLFPSYLFAHLTVGAPGWSKLFSARGVKSVLGAGGKPFRLAAWEIDAIRAREVDGLIDVGVAEPDGEFKPGQHVIVNKGRLGRLDAVFLERIDSRRAAILIQFLGESPRRAEAQLAHIE